MSTLAKLAARGDNGPPEEVVRGALPAIPGPAEPTSFVKFVSFVPKQAGFPNLDDAALDGIVGEIVRAIRPHTEASDAALLFQLLAYFGVLIGRGAYFQVEAEPHHANLFVVPVGQTSKGRKGTSLGHVRRLGRMVDPDFADQRELSGLSSGEGLIWACRDPIIERQPIRERGVVTGYAEVETDVGISDKRLLAVESELARVLAATERESNTLSAVIRDCWDGRTLRILTKKSAATATLPHIGIIGHITADELRRCLSDSARTNGFANRFLYVATERARLLPDGGSLTDSDLGQFVTALRKALAFARTAGRIRRSSEAAELWHEVYGPLSEGKPGTFGAITGRAEAQVVRLSLLFAVLDESPVITVRHLRAALAAWQYCSDTARWIFGDALGDPTADALLARLKAAPSGMTRTELSDAFGRNKSAQEIGRALAVLKNARLADAQTETTEGRPIERWFYTCDGYERNEFNEEGGLDGGA
ncbi:MAG: DUF3987 domain-containing protein [Acidobacteria bacterium]|nr:DUF3987 domain-containing protein [Acidobacteriota bacterium]